MIEKIDSDADIENLYKVGSNAPYAPVVNGFGYYGVLLSHKTTGKIHCHLCGNWYRSLGHHVALKHKIKSREYKKQFGFSALQPLCDNKLSLDNSKNCISKIESGRFGKKGKAFKKGHKTNVGKKHTLAYWNEHSICNEQIAHRVLGISDRIGHYPSSEELRNLDNTLYMLIMRRFGNWNKFKKKQGLPTINKDKRSRDELIYAIRQAVHILQKKPKQSEYAKIAKKYKLPATATIGRMFGSWNRALHAAGLNVV